MTGGFGPGGFGGPGRPNFEYDRVAKPSGIGDVSRYIGELIGGFFSRFAYILGIVWKTGPWILILMALISLFNGVTPVIGSIISQRILNELQVVLAGAGAYVEADFFASPIFYLILFLFIYRLLKYVVTTASSALERIAGELVVKEVRLRIINKAKEIDLASFDIPLFYEKLENANREAGSRPLHIITRTFSIVSLVIELFSFIFILAAAPWLSYSAFVIIAVSVPSAIVNFVYRRKNFRYMRTRSKERRQMNYYSDVLVNKDMAKEIRMLDLSDTFIGKFVEVFNVYYGDLRKLIRNESLWHLFFGVITVLTNLFFYIVIAKEVFAQNILIGDYTLYTGAIGSIATCVASIITTSATIYEGTLFIDNLKSFMNEKKTVVAVADPPVKVRHGEPHTIEFRSVSFKYPQTEKYVLKDVSFTFSGEETVVLVGLNGAGKTTLIKLLTRLYDPSEGCILLDGVDLREYDVADLYSMFGIVFQDFGKYAVSVGDNIAFGDIGKRKEYEQLRVAAEQANALEFIDALAMGMDTPLMRHFEKNGIELSGGQWQKLAIARAFYADSDVLILDEPTAALDPIAEKNVFDQFDRLREKKMSIFVSHRLSSATGADKIVVLENGELIEIGNHDELMKKQGKYYTLFTVQAQKYISGSEQSSENAEREGHRAHRDRMPRGYFGQNN